jgi:hypothetical protein
VHRVALGDLARVYIHAGIKSVLGAVGFVGEHDHIPPVGEGRVRGLRAVGEELLDRGEDHPARADAQKLPNLRARLGPNRSLPQEIAAGREGAEKLLVQIVTVGDDDQGGVFHLGGKNHPSGEEDHGQAFAAAWVCQTTPARPVAPCLLASMVAVSAVLTA